MNDELLEARLRALLDEIAPAVPEARPAGTCPICGTELTGAHCKLVCRNCGYREVCSDLF
ncbi:MAG: hypothetical protein JNG88_15460 [Phycisphaerales bacterium]|nr:hypothetical protein [Phycisphaerales bacterium]